MVAAIHRGWQAADHQLAFALYLAALGGLAFRWLSPLEFLSERAIWSDLLIFAAVVVWSVGSLRTRSRPRIRAFHVALAAYVAATALSAAFAIDRELAAETLLVVCELTALALITSHFAGRQECLGAIVWVVSAAAIVSFALAIAGLGLFYAGVETSLLGVYGEQFIRSDSYARIQAGFYSPPLLASFCIFASALVARDDVEMSGRLRLATQCALAVLVLLTLSRGILAFFAALAIRAAHRRRSTAAYVAAAVCVLAIVGVIAGLTIGRLHLDPTRPSTLTYEVPDPGNRREAAVTSFETFTERPLVGEGPGSLPGSNRGQDFRAHLTPLHIAATMGVPALMAGTFLVVALWRARRRPTPIATWSGLAGLAIDGLAQDVDHFRHVWVLFGVADADRTDRKLTR